MAGFSDSAFDSNAFDVNAFDIGTPLDIIFEGLGVSTTIKKSLGVSSIKIGKSSGVSGTIKDTFGKSGKI